jgi:hypothetical protein
VLLDSEIGALADHIAMLALAQMEPLKECQPLGSIMNLFTPDCANHPVAMTVTDEGYLRGLYKMDAAAAARAQRDQIVYQVGLTMEGR